MSRLQASIILICAGLMLIAAVLGAEANTPEDAASAECPYDGQRPSDEHLKEVLINHRQWSLSFYEGRLDPPDSKKKANLCGANLIGADLSRSDLRGANLNGANLSGAKLRESDLRVADLRGADLRMSDLHMADLGGADLAGANMRGSNLSKANLFISDLKDAHLAFSDITDAIFAPASESPYPYVAAIRGLSAVKFPSGHETGLVQLRAMLEKAGLRDLERQATYAIERGRTEHAIEDWKTQPFRAAWSAIWHVLVGWTTAYGLHPERALLIILAVGTLLVPVYARPIRDRSYSSEIAGIFRVWPKDRIEFGRVEITADNAVLVERVFRRGWRALLPAAYFSLLSAFHIGFREFSVGNWISRLQRNEYTLRPTGWVRTVSGAQSLISVYLLAMWVLTYFGRPFQ